MIYRYSRRYIQFLRPIMHFAIIFGAIPNYNFNTHSITYRYAFKWYTLLVIMLFLVVTCISVNERLHQLPIFGGFTARIILSILQDLVGLITHIIMCTSAAFWNMDTWRKLINNLSLLESKRNLNTEKTIEKMTTNSLLGNANFLFLLGSFYCIGIYILHVYLIQDLTIFLMIFVTLFSMYVEYVVSNLVFNIVLSIKHKYEDINKLLLATGKLAKVRRLYLATNDAVETFNEVFGWYLAGMSLHLTLQFVDCSLVFAINRKGLTRAYILSILYLLITVYGPVMIIFSCDLTVKESTKLLESCTKLQRFLPTDSLENKQLMRLEDLIKNCRPVFTAAGFFRVNRSTLLSLLSTTTTYFIVAIQFNNTP